MDPFMFWELPFLARKNVFRQISPNDVFNLSMTSMNSKLIIMAFHKLPPARLDWYLGRHRSNYYIGTDGVQRVEDEVILNARFPRPWEGQISVNVRDLREGEPLENPLLGNVNRTPILMYYDPDIDFLVCEKDKKRTFDEKIEVMEMISRHLLDIVDVESYDLSYSYHDDLPMDKFIKCFVFDITRKFRVVEISNHFEKLKAPELDFLMNEIEVDEMDMSVKGRQKGVFTHPKIVFDQHLTVSFDNIFNLKSERFEAQMHRIFKPEELVRLLVAWADGEKLQNLKWMRIFFGFGSYKKNLIGRVTKRMQEMEGEVSFEILEIEQDDEDADEDDEVVDEEDVADEQDEEESDEESEDDTEQEDVEMADEAVSNGKDVEEGAEQKQEPEIVAQSANDEIEQDNPEEIADEQEFCDIEAEEEQEMVDENDGSDENDDEDHDEDEAVSNEEDEEQDGDNDDEDDDSESDSEEEEESDEENDEDNIDINEICLQRKIDGKVLRLLYGYTSFEIVVFDENDYFNDLLESN